VITLNNSARNTTVKMAWDGTQILFSYATPVTAFIPHQGYIRTDQFYSVTTTKHINRWVKGECRKVTQAEIEALLAALA
jgi:hypothetical protein